MSDKIDICKTYNDLKKSDKYLTNDILKLGTKCNCKRLCDDISKVDNQLNKNCYEKCTAYFDKDDNIRSNYHSHFHPKLFSIYHHPYKYHYL